MGAPGFDDAPLTRVMCDRDVANDVTMIYPYYENPVFLRRQLEHWATWDLDLKGAIRVIVVDDGSPRNPAEIPIREWMRDQGPMPIALQLYRIEVDVRWNWLAARNIGAHQAPANHWLLLTDMDHVVPENTADTLVYGDFNPGWIWNFQRREHTGDQIHPHPNSLFLSRDMFWRVGGYDEALSGHYGTDGDWRRRCALTAPVKRMPEYLVRHEYQADSSTTDYLRKQPQDAGKKKIIRTRGPDWRPRVLSFPFKRVI